MRSHPFSANTRLSACLSPLMALSSPSRMPSTRFMRSASRAFFDTPPAVASSTRSASPSTPRMATSKSAADTCVAALCFLTYTGGVQFCSKYLQMSSKCCGPKPSSLMTSGSPPPSASQSTRRAPSSHSARRTDATGWTTVRPPSTLRQPKTSAFARNVPASPPSRTLSIRSIGRSAKPPAKAAPPSASTRPAPSQATLGIAARLWRLGAGRPLAWRGAEGRERAPRRSTCAKQRA
mmetsp:Transcript_41265/g.124551  ORF Transcript_41265/g.124551 Transcript_41265/m.124551 type:complete len:236 (+) Transcript_41265:273-980(+)